MKTYIGILIYFYSLSVFANTGIEIKAELNNVSCQTTGIQVQFDLFIKNSMATKAYIGNQNYRIHFDLDGIILNSFNITEVGNIEGVGFEGGNFYLMDPPNLLGSTKDRLSLNINHSGSIGYPLEQEWVHIASLEFLTDGSEDCFNSIIQPVSNIASESYFSEFDGVNYEILEIETFQNFDVCLSDYCEICPLNIVLESQVDDFDELNETELIQAGNEIIANNKISNGSNVTYDANNGVTLSYGFEVVSPSTFQILLDGCETNYNSTGN